MATREVTKEGHVIRLEEIVPNKDCINVDYCKYEHRNCHRMVCYTRRLREYDKKDEVRQ